MSNKIKIYFLGSGKIAVPILEVLRHADGIHLCGIGTQLDRPAGRNRQLQPTPIGRYAAETRIAIDKIHSVNADAFLESMHKTTPDIILVVSFGQLLKAPILALPRLGCMNVHASLLPRYRGASPIAATILNRDAQTGVTFMRMDKGLDTGDIYKMCELPLSGHEYADELENTLGLLAAADIVSVIRAVADGGCIAVKQDNSAAMPAHKIGKADGAIDWTMPAERIEAIVRAYHPWPGAWFTLTLKTGNTILRITQAKIIRGSNAGRPGEIISTRKHFVIACGKEALEIVKLVPSGKNEMTGAAFLNGYQPTAIASGLQ